MPDMGTGGERQASLESRMETVRIPEIADPHQVGIYDAVNSYSPGTQPDFYLGVAEEIGAEVVIDFGWADSTGDHHFVVR